MKIKKSIIFRYQNNIRCQYIVTSFLVRKGSKKQYWNHISNNHDIEKKRNLSPEIDIINCKFEVKFIKSL